MSTSHLFAKPKKPQNLPSCEEFLTKAASHIGQAQNENDLRHIGIQTRELLDVGQLSSREANNLWASMSARSAQLATVAKNCNEARLSLLASGYSDILRDVCPGMPKTLHQGRPITRDEVSAACRKEIDTLVQSMREAGVLTWQIGPTLVQPSGRYGWTLVPHRVEVSPTNSPQHHEVVEK